MECFYSTDSHPESVCILNNSRCVLLKLILHFLTVLMIVCSKYTHNLLQFIIYVNTSTFLLLNVSESFDKSCLTYFSVIFSLSHLYFACFFICSFWPLAHSANVMLLHCCQHLHCHQHHPVLSVYSHPWWHALCQWVHIWLLHGHTSLIDSH